MRAEPASERPRAAKIASGAVQALGMLLVARACDLMGTAAVVQAIPEAGSLWWSAIPGWAAFVWLSKRAAAARWWRAEGAWALGALSLVGGFLFVAWAGPAFGAGWTAALLWGCVWPLARARLEAAEARARPKEAP